MSEIWHACISKYGFKNVEKSNDSDVMVSVKMIEYRNFKCQQQFFFFPIAKLSTVNDVEMALIAQK